MKDFNPQYDRRFKECYICKREKHYSRFLYGYLMRFESSHCNDCRYLELTQMNEEYWYRVDFNR